MSNVRITFNDPTGVTVPASVLGTIECANCNAVANAPVAPPWNVNVTGSLFHLKVYFQCLSSNGAFTLNIVGGSFGFGAVIDVNNPTGTAPGTVAVSGATATVTLSTGGTLPSCVLTITVTVP